MIELLLPSGIIASLFFILWIIKYPDIVCSTMLFKDGEILWGLATWLFFTGFISTVVLLTTLAL